LQHLKWKQIEFREMVIKVKEDRRRGQKIKDRAERRVPLTGALAAKLLEWREQRPNTVPVLGTDRDRVNRKWLQTLKRTAKRAGLNCNNCDGCLSYNECNIWKLKTLYNSLS
jgi:integrase